MGDFGDGDVLTVLVTIRTDWGNGRYLWGFDDIRFEYYMTTAVGTVNDDPGPMTQHLTTVPCFATDCICQTTFTSLLSSNSILSPHRRVLRGQCERKLA